MARTTKTQSTDRTRTRNRQEILEERRKVRTDLGSMKSRITYPTDRPDLHFRLVNDVEDRVLMFQKMGWYVWDGENVQVGDPDQVIENNITPESGVRVPVGGGITAVLMCIPRELYEADQYLREEELQRTEEAMNKRLHTEGLTAYDRAIDTRAKTPTFVEEED